MKTKRKSTAQRTKLNRLHMQQARTSRPLVELATSIAGNYHQGHQRFGTAAGKQCTCTVLYFFLLYTCTASQLNSWTPTDIDNILHNGTEIYNRLQAERPAVSYFLLNELPQYIQVLEKTFHLQYQESLCGALDVDEDNPTALQYSLRHALLQASEHHTTLFVTIGNRNPSYTLGIIKQEGFFVFDSHSRDSYGMATEHGQAVLLKVTDSNHLHDHIKELATSLNVDGAYFEVTAVKIVDITSCPQSSMLRYLANQAAHQQAWTISHIQDYTRSGNQDDSQDELQQDKSAKQCLNQENQSTHKTARKKKQNQQRMEKLRQIATYKSSENLANKQRIHQLRRTTTFKAKELIAEQQRKSKKRQEPQYRNKEQAMDTQRRKTVRQMPENKVEEQATNTQWRKTKRQVPGNRKKEQAADTERRKTIRLVPENKVEEQATNTQWRKTKRQVPGNRKKEQAADTERRKTIRLVPENKVEEQATNTQWRKTKRQVPGNRKKEQATDTERRKTIRHVPENKVKEQATNTQWRKTKRQVPGNRKKEQAADTERRRTVRQVPENRDKEQVADTRRRKTVRRVPGNRDKEQVADTRRRKMVRQAPGNRDKEQVTDTRRRKTVRRVPGNRDKEQVADTRRRKTVRRAPGNRDKEQVADTRRRKTVRRVPGNRDKEQVADTRRRKTVRKMPDRRAKEQRSNTTRMQQARESPNQRRKEAEAMKQSRRKKKTNSVTNMQQLIKAFQLSSKDACTYICASCDQLWFKESVTTFNHESYPGLDGHWLCHTCKNALRKKKIPRYSKLNKMSFPEQPPELHLTELEERLISPVNVFFQLRELPRGRQASIHGNAVNVPADNISTVSMLPKRTSDAATIPVKLKRRLRYKSHALFQNVRPARCVAATTYLLQNSDLFKLYVPQGFDPHWMATITSAQSEGTTHDDATIETTIPNGQNSTTENPDSNSNDTEPQNAEDAENDDWTERATDHQPDTLPNTGDTLLTTYPFTDDGQHVFTCAPSEQNQPISILSDDIEELAYPTIFCGQRRPSHRQVRVSYSDICKAELRHKDRRAAKSISNIFFKTKKLQMKQIKDKVWLSLRRIKTKGNTYTAGDFHDDTRVQQMVKLDEGYKIFRTLRGSPPYWEHAKKDAFAMVRQLGVPTFFFSLSSADTRWPGLLIALSKLLDGIDLTEEDIPQLSWETKTRLIRSDPVTVSRYFNNRVTRFIADFLQSPLQPLGEILDYFYRIEFQQRGSPHIHGILWVADAPRLDSSHGNSQEVEQFIDSYITATSTDVDSNLIGLQTHRHTHTCKKTTKNKTSCRFHFPQPPMESTKVLQPLQPDDVTTTDEQNWTQITTYLQNNEAEYANFTYNEFLQELNMTSAMYIRAIRSSLTTTKIYLKRRPADVRVNSFNQDILAAWNANMDIQYVTNAYACIAYIVNYMNKAEKGMSQLLHYACQEARQANSDIRQQVRIIGNKFLRNVEVSAQEACYLVMQLPMRRASRSVQFINTSPPEERPLLLKSLDELEQLPDDSEEIHCTNILMRYAMRPSYLAEITCADFASKYNLKQTKQKSYRQKKRGRNQDTPETTMEENTEDDPYSDEEHQEPGINEIQLENGEVMVRRQKQKIIRYVRYNRDNDPDNYFREQLLLFYPWKNEATLTEPFTTHEEKFHAVATQIQQNRQQYEQNSKELDEANQLITQGLTEEDNLPEVAPNTQHINQQDQFAYQAELQNEDTAENEVHHTDYDTGIEYGLPAAAGSGVTEELLHNRLNEQDYRQLIRSYNKEQREIYFHVLKCTQTSTEPFFIFLSGGAGVGKTRVTQGIYQALVRQYNQVEGQNPEQQTVLLTAPTGKAAYLIKGSTIHRTFGVPCNQKLQYKNLNSSNLTTMRHNLAALKVLIIDEISMCGTRLFNYINLRLQDVFNNTKPFGGVSVIAVGDLFQLQPVKDSWIFMTPQDNYSPLSPNMWTELFKIFELKEVMRQKEDLTFAQLLNRFREAKHTKEDIELIQTRVISTDTTNTLPHVTHLMYENNSVNQHNTAIFNQCCTTKLTQEASDIVIGPVPNEAKQAILNRAPKKAGDAMGLAKYVSTGVGLTNELTVNLDVGDGLVNGATCKTMHIQSNVIWVKFDDDAIGKKAQAEQKHLYTNNIDPTWVPITPIKRELPAGRYQNVKISRLQYPIVIAAAKTIHRSQGDTLTEAVVKFPQRRLSHLHYVAMSRITKLENLYLTHFNPEKVSVDSRVEQEMARLRREATLRLNFTPLYDQPPASLKIYFHNCQSLRLHYDDIASDLNLQTADVSLLVETKLCSTDPQPAYQIPTFTMHRNDYSSIRTPYGSCIYFKNHIAATCHSLNYQEIEMTHITIPSRVQIVSIYCRPGENITKINEAMAYLKQNLNRLDPVVIIGDFNINANGENRSKYNNFARNMLKDYNYRQYMYEPTTQKNTTIDLIFSNLPTHKINCGSLETYYSYHKPLWATLKL